MNTKKISKTNIAHVGLILLLTFCLLLSPSSSLFLTADTAFAEDMSGDEALLIGSPEELFEFATNVNAGNSYEGQTVKLTADIDLNDVEWTPIGSYVNNKPFAGIFDGDDYIIEGLSITSGTEKALFGYHTGTLKNFIVEGKVSGTETVAGVVARPSGSITGVTNRVTVYATGNYVGGIAADAAGDFYIADCRNEGFLSNSSDTRSSGKLGGIIARAETWTNGVIERCMNEADILGYQYIGGIAGGVFGNVEIRECYNTGNLEGKSFGKVYMGGIAGKLEGGTIDSCYNLGEIFDNRIDKTRGNMRALGGIAGCEEHHTVGTAITNVYQAGLIHFDTEGIDHEADNHYMMMSGHISGGNNSTAANTMTYENCFYETGCYPQAEPDHPDWVLFRHDEGLKLWDTEYVTEVSRDELHSPEMIERLGAAFSVDEKGINNGYPVLVWQNGSDEVAERLYNVVDTRVLGGNSTVNVQPESAPAGTTISISADSIDMGKRIYKTIVTDASGKDIEVSKDANNLFTFAMPRRNVNIKVVLENDVVGGNTYSIAAPDELDGIWTITSESSSGIGEGSALSENSHKAGTTVFLNVNKNPEARSTELKQVRVYPLTDSSPDAEGVSPLILSELTGDMFAFTMPECDVRFELEVSYAELSVGTQRGTAEPEWAKGYSRAQMESLSTSNIYYSAWSSETDPMIGRADSSVKLLDLLADANVSFEPGDTLRLESIDGMFMSYKYEELFGVNRYYYPNIFTESTAGKEIIEPIFTIKQNVLLRSESIDGETEPPIGDTLTSYRFIFGQSQDEFENHTKIVDRQVKYITFVTVVKKSNITGDVDGDGDVTILDAITMINIIMGVISPTAEQIVAADLDNGGDITVVDLIILINQVMGI